MRLYFWLLMIGTSTASAQSVSERFENASPSGFVEAFVGHCAQNAGRNDKVEAAARALDFTALTGDMLAMLGPQNPDASFSGWMVMEGAGAPYLLGVSEGDLDGTAMNICTLANPYLNTPEVVAQLPKWFGEMSLLADDVSLGQRLRVWDATDIADDAVVTLTDASPSGYGGATLALTAPAKQQ